MIIRSYVQAFAYRVERLKCFERMCMSENGAKTPKPVGGRDQYLGTKITDDDYYIK